MTRLYCGGFQEQRGMENQSQQALQHSPSFDELIFQTRSLEKHPGNERQNISGN